MRFFAQLCPFGNLVFGHELEFSKVWRELCMHVFEGYDDQAAQHIFDVNNKCDLCLAFLCSEKTSWPCHWRLKSGPNMRPRKIEKSSASCKFTLKSGRDDQETTKPQLEFFKSATFVILTGESDAQRRLNVWSCYLNVCILIFANKKERWDKGSVTLGA